MNVVIVKPKEKAYAKEIDGELESMQEIVGGWITTFPHIIDGEQFIGVCDEEGLLKEKQVNFETNGMPIVGTVIISKYESGEDLSSLTQEEAETIVEHFNQAR